jgi:tRNA (guanine-N7-)-methyltransferase
LSRRQILGVSIEALPSSFSEPLSNILSTKAKEQNQKNNIHFIDGQFLYFAKELFTSLQNANISVKSISIQFPDPWRRKKHEKRLLVQPKLVGMLADVLPIGAVVYFCSDVEAEVKRMDSVFCKNEQFVTGEPTKELYPFVSVPTERTLVCENMHRAVWTGMAQKRGVSM